MKYLFSCWVVLFAFWQTCYAQQSNDRNYVLSRTYKQAGADVNDVSKVMTQIQYIDGLGRPVQNVTVGQSPSGSDFVQPMQYDAVGRQNKQFLPYIAAGKGAYQNSAVSDVETWYSANSALLKRSVPADPLDVSRPYGETNFEPSPLNRAAGQRAAGGRSASSATQYLVNEGSQIKKYDFSSGNITSNGFYTAGTLSRSKYLDEQQNESNEYTDSDGRLICKQTLTGTETLSTYYVYDAIGHLRGVLQPNYQDDGSLANSAFQYEYDERGRVIAKQIPGSGRVEIVYDVYDRPVMSRDANQLSAGKWGFTKYDALNRPVATGEISSTTDRSTWAATLSLATGHHENRENSLEAGYTLNLTAPAVTPDKLLTLTFYDDYAFLTPANLEFHNSYYAAKNNSVAGQMTGSRARVLNSDGSIGVWLTSVVYYDAEYRMIQTSRELFDLGAGGSAPLAVELILNKYQYDVAPVISEKYETILNTGYNNGHTSTYTYDHADRLLSVKEKVSYRSKDKEAYTLAQRYNVLGQLQSKWFHSTDNIKYRRRTDYTNNIRGWLTDGRTVYKQAAGSNDLPFYGFGLEYAGTSNYTNGNISAMRWLGKDETSYSKGLSFSYDGANRLTGSVGISNYAETESGISYDKNGNIKTLARAGAAVDNLTYSYNGNRLGSVTDGSGNNTGLKSGSSGFAYDANGNMTVDNTKGSSGAVITYNQLNLPRTVVIDGKTMTYDYDAAGIKSKYVSDTTTIKYAGSFEFNHNYALRKVATSAGQVVPNDTLRFDYFLKDRLGNVRVVFDEKGKILQKTDYYPFGLSVPREDPAISQADRNKTNRYLYNEKELQVGSGYVDYGARMYMPEVGRMAMVDGASEVFDDVSPYIYGLNNPLLNVDPSGDTTINVNDLQDNWDNFNPQTDDVQLGGVTIGSKSNADYSMPQPGTQVMMPVEGFWEEASYFLSGRSYDGRYVDRQGILQNQYVPITGVAPDVGFKSGINSVYSATKNGLPYIGKTFNVLKRYTFAQRTNWNVKAILNGINDPKTLRAVEQTVKEYKETLGKIANERNAFDPNRKDYAEYMMKAQEWLQTNAPNWKDLF